MKTDVHGNITPGGEGEQDSRVFQWELRKQCGHALFWTKAGTSLLGTAAEAE